jgi:hypothetical protein
MRSALAAAVERFTLPQDEAQLQALEQALGAVVPASCGQEELALLLGVFERFPGEDGFGIFWSIVHLLEATAGYEPALVSSVLRKPVEFNLLMVNRLLNAGVVLVEGQSLLSLLHVVASREDASPRAREEARRFIEYQKRGHGRTEA